MAITEDMITRGYFYAEGRKLQNENYWFDKTTYSHTKKAALKRIRATAKRDRQQRVRVKAAKMLLPTGKRIWVFAAKEY